MFVNLITSTTTRETLERDTKITQNDILNSKQEITSDFFNPIVETLANLNK